MPCYDPETHEAPIRMAGKINHLTRLLCAICTSLDKGEDMPPEDAQAVFQWWQKHKAWDEEIARVKKKREEQGDEALTPQERGVLWTGDSDRP